MDLRDLLIEFRAKNCISMNKVAELAGITVQTVHNIETKNFKPRRTTEKKILLLIENFKKQEE